MTTRGCFVRFAQNAFIALLIICHFRLNSCKYYRKFNALRRTLRYFIKSKTGEKPSVPFTIKKTIGQFIHIFCFFSLTENDLYRPNHTIDSNIVLIAVDGTRPIHGHWLAFKFNYFSLLTGSQTARTFNCSTIVCEMFFSLSFRCTATILIVWPRAHTFEPI